MSCIKQLTAIECVARNNENRGGAVTELVARRPARFRINRGIERFWRFPMSAPTDEAQRVRGYLLSQANKLSIPALVDKVRRDTLPVRDAALAVPAHRLRERPGPDDWSAAEVL